MPAIWCSVFVKVTPDKMFNDIVHKSTQKNSVELSDFEKVIIVVTMLATTNVTIVTNW